MSIIPEKDVKDYFNRSGATQLASAIEVFWRRRGFSGIKAWAHRLSPAQLAPDMKQARIYIVKSNIGRDGYPPRLAEAA